MFEESLSEKFFADAVVNHENEGEDLIDVDIDLIQRPLIPTIEVRTPGAPIQYLDRVKILKSAYELPFRTHS
jgi:hypothetical protein